MVKEIAIGKRAKISQAQQYMIFAVVGASLFLGVAIAMVSNFIKLISFNTRIIMAQEESIVNYSNFIKSVGICKSPRGSIYSNDELARCNPDGIEISEIPGTLRSNILENLAASEALNSVPKEDVAECKKENGKQYTYKDLMSIYQKAENEKELVAANQLLKTCSALRVIPDALPKDKNEEALLASLNKLFLVADWEPEALSPSGTSSASSTGTNLNTISVNLSIEADAGTTTNVLNNIERSIREFDIGRATIEWGGNDSLIINAQATAYFVNESIVSETTKRIPVEEK